MLVKVGNTNVDVRVEAVLSVPRLGFMDNFFTWAQALTPLGIRPTKSDRCILGGSVYNA
jgi:hypothetical protein